MGNFTREAKPASEQTKKYQKDFAARLGIDIENANNQEVELSASHAIKITDDLVIKNEDGHEVWNLNEYSFLKEQKVPDTINPSLWLNAKSCFSSGLFWVVQDKIFQVRGFDLANITFIRSKTGFIVLDTGTFLESSKAAIEFAEKELGEDIRNHIRAVIISHSHTDHYGGIAGVVTPEQVGDPSEGKIPIYVPEGFDEEAVSENIYAGIAMGRRGRYQFAGGLRPGTRSVVSGGLGLCGGLYSGTSTYIAPTHEIKEDQTLFIDGLEVVFQLTPGTEAPAEMNNYFPEYRAFWAAENCTGTLHNFYPIRGAKVRDSSIWADFTIEALEKFGDRTDVVFQSHHWPHWNTKEEPNAVKEYLTKTAAIYKYIHDQTLLYANQGLKPNEIVKKLEIPQKLQQSWFIRPYYGSVEVNAKAVYQRYLGYYDANPVNLDPLTDAQEAEKFIEYVGSSKEVLEKAKQDFDKGNYQWAAKAANYVVKAEPDNEDAKLLCADAIEQLGYRAESSIWRNAYLTGAWELRNGLPKQAEKPGRQKLKIIDATNARRALGYLGIVIDGAKAAEEDLKFRLIITDTYHDGSRGAAGSAIKELPNGNSTNSYHDGSRGAAGSAIKELPNGNSTNTYHDGSRGAAGSAIKELPNGNSTSYHDGSRGAAGSATITQEQFVLHLYAGTLLIYEGETQEELPTVKGPKKLIAALIRKELDSVKEEIETEIYEDLKRVESYVVDLIKTSQFSIID